MLIYLFVLFSITNQLTNFNNQHFKRSYLALLKYREARTRDSLSAWTFFSSLSVPRSTKLIAVSSLGGGTHYMCECVCMCVYVGVYACVCMCVCACVDMGVWGDILKKCFPAPHIQQCNTRCMYNLSAYNKGTGVPQWRIYH